MSQHWSYWLECSMMFDALSFGRRVDPEPAAEAEEPEPIVASAIQEDDVPVLAFQMPVYDDEPVVSEEEPFWTGAAAA